MSGNVKQPKRRYNSASRKAAATQTRIAVIEGARRVFTSRGYGGATIAEIAEEAGVAPQTVYSHFQTKRGVLNALVDASIVGDLDGVPLAARPGWTAVMEAGSAADGLRGFASIAREVYERTGDVFELMRCSASSDSEVAADYDEHEARRHADCRRVATAVAERGELAAGLDVDGAADVVWAMASPTLYFDLVHRRGWTPTEYEAWLRTALVTVLTRGVPARQRQ